MQDEKINKIHVASIIARTLNVTYLSSTSTVNKKYQIKN